MNEQAKIDEAQHFLEKMHATVPDPDSFKHELSAFLSAARSALQYALKEARTKPGGQAWYDGEVTVHQVTPFLTEKRNISVHSKPITPVTNVSISVHEVAVFAEACSIKVRKDDGTEEPERFFPSQPPQRPTTPPPTVTYDHTFSDRPGSEDVLTLCTSYLAEIKRIVADGVAHGFLTP